MQPTLLVMAAGMGSRYGGLKQIDPVGPNGEIIIDYSIYDAVKAGFGKVVFIIRHHFEEAFKDKIGRKVERVAETAYACQELEECLYGHEIPQGREKPWGTGHAILVARAVVEGPFAVINADDYYGADSLKVIADFLAGGGVAHEKDYAMVGYVLRNTLSEYGHVSRGVCECDGELFLKKIKERKKVRKDGLGAIYTDPEGKDHKLTGDEVVSMNLWGFGLSIFEHLEVQFKEFLSRHGQELKSELYIPSVVDGLVESGQVQVKVLPTHDTWFGVTYQEDKALATASINKLISEGVYPERLWED